MIFERREHRKWATFLPGSLTGPFFMCRMLESKETMRVLLSWKGCWRLQKLCLQVKCQRAESYIDGRGSEVCAGAPYELLAENNAVYAQSKILRDINIYWDWLRLNWRLYGRDSYLGINNKNRSILAKNKIKSERIKAICQQFSHRPEYNSIPFMKTQHNPSRKTWPIIKKKF